MTSLPSLRALDRAQDARIWLAAEAGRTPSVAICLYSARAGATG